MINPNIAWSKHRFNPKIERKSAILSKERRDYCNKNQCGRGENYIPNQLIYIYAYPKNINKMIKENPEFKDEIEKKQQWSYLVQYNETENGYFEVNGFFKDKYENYIECFPEKDICDDNDEIIERFKEIVKCLPWKHQCDDDFNINEALNEVKIYDKNNKKLIELLQIVRSGKKMKYNAIKIKNCKDLWKYPNITPYTNSMMMTLPNFEQHCNKIVKKILKKTGKLY